MSALVNSTLSNHCKKFAPRLVQQTGLSVSPSTKQKNLRWRYLISNNMEFSDRSGYNIQLPKPDDEQLVDWLYKLITSGEVSTIFVEQLSLKDADESHLHKLCLAHQVKLVNLSPMQKTPNIVQGPW
jgi:hypothetical protein